MSRTETTKNEEIATTEDIDPESNEKFKTHPDGGWGWCIVIAAFLTQFVVVGLQNSSGVIFNELVEKFNRPRGETGTKFCYCYYHEYCYNGVKPTIFSADSAFKQAAGS